jgi:hypothetical protein
MLLAGCGDGAGSSRSVDASATPTPTTATAAASADDAGYDDIPTVDELERRLAVEVTEANADAEFLKLQQALDAEEDG